VLSQDGAVSPMAARRRVAPPRPSSSCFSSLWSGGGRVFSRAQLRDGRDVEIDGRTADVQVGLVRKALSRPGERDPSRTVRGAGYAFDETYGAS
jgi:DNA-binding response OmpR family regulator